MEDLCALSCLLRQLKREGFKGMLTLHFDERSNVTKVRKEETVRLDLSEVQPNRNYEEKKA